MRFGSLFSGVGGFDLGFERAGMECAWQAERDKFALQVLNTVDRAHFLKGYDQLRDREAHGRVQLPGIKQLAEKLSQPKQLKEPA